MHENERKWILLKLSIEERDKVFVPLLSLSYPLRRRKNKRKEEKKKFQVMELVGEENEENRCRFF